jgi:hypothetical protein
MEAEFLRGMYRTLPSMNAEQCKAMLRRLTEFDNRRETWADVIHREKVWIRIASGWAGAIGYEIQSLSNDDGEWGTFAATRGPHMRVPTLCRLMIAELAIRAYQLDNGHAPHETAELVPDYLAESPTDPYDVEGNPLRFAFANGQLKVWSIGQDGSDDSGKPLPRDADGYIDEGGDGDLSLADYFKPEGN